MTTHSESRIVPYTAELMYAVVSDVERYPEFLPWCRGLRVLDRQWAARDGLAGGVAGGPEIIIAEMLVGFGAFNERYTSRVILDPAARKIDVTQTEGVFRALETHWRFTPEGESCRVDFAIAFEFKSRLLGAVAGKAFADVFVKMSEAYEARAKMLSEKTAQEI
jgi:coenzyme Q-binding protein COQ10